MGFTVEKVGTEFLVNSQGANDQRDPMITSLAGGGFIVTWVTQDTSQDGSSNAIKAQLFTAAGVKSGAEFLVNSQTTDGQVQPAVTGLAGGGFVVTWYTGDFTQDGSAAAVKAQVFTAGGIKAGSEFLVNTATTNFQSEPAITGLVNGGFVATWKTDDRTQDGSGPGIKAQVFTASGVKAGPEFLANTQATSSQRQPTITDLANGGFVITWATDDAAQDGSGSAIKAQIFSAAGAKAGPEFLVNSRTVSFQGDPMITGLVDGGFVVTWRTSDTTQDGSSDAIKAQVFTAAGAKAGPEFLVNTQTVSGQVGPSIAALSDGGFVVSWITGDPAQDGSGNAIKAQVFTAAGAKAGPEFLVNTQLASDQAEPSVTGLADGGFVVSWSDTSGTLGDASGYSIKAQVFTLVPDNAAPEIAGGEAAAFDVAENETTVATFTATDPDAGDMVEWSLAGDDAGLFTIDSAGNLAFTDVPDFEAPSSLDGDNVYSLTVVASDGDAFDSQVVTVTVTDRVAGDTFFLDDVSPDTTTASPGVSYDRIVGAGANDSVRVAVEGGSLAVGASGDGSAITIDWDGDTVTDLSITGVPELLLNAASVTVSGDLSATGLSPDTILYTGDAGANLFDASGMISSESVNASGLGGNDTLTGAGGNDYLQGGDNDDLLRGLDGLDYLIGGSGIDTASYTGTIAGIAATASDWEVGDGTANDQLEGVEIVDDAAAGKYLLVGNGAFTSIQAAIDAAQAGDTILVAAGSYVETVTINKAVTLQGANAGTTGNGARAAEAVIEGQVTIAADATLDGFQILNSSANGVAFFGVSVTGDVDATIANNIFYSAGVNGQSGAGEDRAINLDTTATGSVTITGNLFTGASQANFSTASWARGIWTDGASSLLTIDGNEFNWTRTAINLDGYEASRVDVTNNNFANAGTAISVGSNAVGNDVLITDFSLNLFGNVGTDYNLQNIGASKSVNLVVGSVADAGDPITALLGQGNDVYTGTSRTDIVVGNGGNDIIFTGAGNDLVYGGAGTDRVILADQLTAAKINAVADADLITPGDQAGWQVASEVSLEGTDLLAGVEIVDGNEAGRFLLVGNGGFATIQAAVNAALSGDTILIAAGTYTEQVLINAFAGLTLQAAGNGSVTIKAPEILAVNGQSEHWGVDVRAVVSVNASTGVTLKDLDIDGSFAGDTTAGSNGDELAGVAFLNSSGRVDAVDIANVANSVGGGLFGLQHGAGILVDGSSGATDNVVIANSAVGSFQKTGILAWGVEYLEVADSTITGIGATDLIAQNGIQVGGSGSFIGYTAISGIGYSPATTYGAGVIVYEPTGSTTLESVSITGAGPGSAGIDLTDTQGQPVSFQNVFLDNLDYGLVAYSYAGGTLGLDVSPSFGFIGTSNIGVLGMYFDPEFSVFDPFATSTDFTLPGTMADDELSGSNGNDSFTGRGGNDALNGRAGTDTAIFAGTWADHVISEAAGVFTLESAGEGTDTAQAIETFVFADGTLTAAELLNVAPEDLAIDGSSVLENAADGTLVGTATASDDNALDAIAYSLTDNADGRFAIDSVSGALTVANGSLLNREAAASHQVTVAVTDLGGLQTTQLVTISVGDVDEFDVSTPIDADAAANSVSENAANGTLVGVTALATDPDATTSSVSYSLTDNAGGRFAINPLTGVISVANGSLLDLEVQASHQITVQAASADLSAASETFTINLGNVVETKVYLGTAGADSFTATSDDNWTIDGKAGNDTLTSAGGDDVVIAGAGNDIISTGGGNDLITFKGAAGANGFEQIDGGAGFDELRALAANTAFSLAALTGVELINGNGFANVSIVGSTAADVLDFSGTTLNGIVQINTGVGNDSITGSAGNDVILGGAGNDVLAGGFGDDDFLVGANQNIDSIDGGAGFDQLLATAANVKIGLSSTNSLEQISANGFANVTITGTSGADLIDMSLIDLVGIAALDGAVGNDTLIGSSGADRLVGAGGLDQMTGGLGADIFDFNALGDSRTTATDILTDFEQGLDLIDLLGVDASSKSSGNQAFTFIETDLFSRVAGELRYEQVGGNTRILGDTNGDAKADFVVELQGLHSLVLEDFLL